MVKLICKSRRETDHQRGSAGCRCNRVASLGKVARDGWTSGWLELLHKLLVGPAIHIWHGKLRQILGQPPIAACDVVPGAFGFPKLEDLAHAHVAALVADPLAPAGIAHVFDLDTPGGEVVEDWQTAQPNGGLVVAHGTLRTGDALPDQHADQVVLVTYEAPRRIPAIGEISLKPPLWVRRTETLQSQTRQVTKLLRISQ
jgi:hypothetical protein